MAAVPEPFALQVFDLHGLENKHDLGFDLIALFDVLYNYIHP